MKGNGGTTAKIREIFSFRLVGLFHEIFNIKICGISSAYMQSMTPIAMRKPVPFFSPL